MSGSLDFACVCVSPVDKDGDGENDDEDKADHHGNHLMHCYCTCVGEKGEKQPSDFKSAHGDDSVCSKPHFAIRRIWYKGWMNDGFFSGFHSCAFKFLVFVWRRFFCAEMMCMNTTLNKMYVRPKNKK